MNVRVTYQFKYDEKSEERSFDFDVPFEEIIKGIEFYFSRNDVNIDGTNKDIWNLIVADLNCLDKIADDEDVINYWKELLYEDAYDAFREEVEEETEWLDDEDNIDDLTDYLDD